MNKPISLAILLTLLALLTSCGEENYGPVERSWGKMKGLENLVGNMNDTSYSRSRDKMRPNALNQQVTIADFAGTFIWAEYAAPWCSACPTQTKETKKVERMFTDDVLFLTIMTSKSPNYDDHATAETAKSWSRRFQLNPEHVLAAKLWSKTIPEHRLYSPQGHTLFVHVGYLNSQQITDVINFYTVDWVEWDETGESAPWMKF